MHITIPDAQSTLHLEQLVAKSSFLRLTTSKAQYPNAPGAGLPLLVVETPLCSAVIALQGAHLLEFKTTDGDPLLWLSPNCDFTPGVALRGGVPLCLPWFGVNQAECCAGDRGDCVPTSSVAVAPAQPLEPAIKPSCEQTRR